jgi:hypothetical protein
MSITLKPGVRLFSAVCTTEMIVVRVPPGGGIDLTIGGAPPLTSAADRDSGSSVTDGYGGGAAIGKRYVDDEGTIELLCTKAGPGVPAIGGKLLNIKDAKPLPSSD